MMDLSCLDRDDFLEVCAYAESLAMVAWRTPLHEQEEDEEEDDEDENDEDGEEAAVVVCGVGRLCMHRLSHRRTNATS